MIQTRQRQPPRELLANQLKWTKRWQASRPKQWALKRAKTLLLETVCWKSFGKCVFCESTLDVSGFAQIEHYHAKTVRPELTFDWDNLFLACGYCNNRKRDADHAGRLLEPDVDDGEQHLWFDFRTGELAASGARGKETIHLCDLNRPGLCKARLRQYRLTMAILQQLTDTGTLKKRFRRIAFDPLSPQAQYKLVIRAELPVPVAERDRRKYHAAV